MKQFDLEAAKKGAAVCTRDGRDARIICWDFTFDGGSKIIALVDDTKRKKKNLKYESALVYDHNGKNALLGSFGYNNGKSDLVMKPEKKEGWINIFANDMIERISGYRIFATKGEALEERRVQGYVDTIKIKWEE